MTYDEISKEIGRLSYRDKFRLAQLLIQKARKEEEEQTPTQRQGAGSKAKPDEELILCAANIHAAFGSKPYS